MRYELDANGYVKIVVWGCETGNCAEYTGTVPSGYSNLTEWSEKAIINAYYINEQGNLTLDSERLADLEAQIEQDAIDNQPILHKDLYGTNNVLADQYYRITASGNVIEAENVKKINPEVMITNVNSPKIDIVAQGKQMLKNDAKSYSGKNLLNMDMFTDNVVPSINGGQNVNAPGNTATSYIEIDNSLPLVLSMPQTIKTKYTFYYDENYNFIGYKGNSTQTYLEISKTEYYQNAKYIRVRVDGSLKTTMPQIQLEYSETVTEYEPYFKITKDIDGSITLNGRVEGKNLIDWSKPSSTIGTFENDVITVTTTGAWKSRTYDILDVVKKNPGKRIYFSCESFTMTSAGHVQINWTQSGTVKYNGLMSYTGSRNSLLIPEDTSEITKATLCIYSNNSSDTTTEYTTIITKPMLYFDTALNTPEYEPYGNPIEYNICGDSNSTSSIFALKKDEDYYLNLEDLECSMKYYDGTSTNIVYEGIDGIINLSENKEVTQVTLKIPTGVTFDNKVIYPMLNYGSEAYEYEEYKAKKISFDISEYIGSEALYPAEDLYPADNLYPLGTSIDYIHIADGKIFISVDGVVKYLNKGNVNLYDGYNLIYTMQDTIVNIDYCINNLRLEGTVTKNNNFKVLEDGSIEAHNGKFSGTIEAHNGTIGGWVLDWDGFTNGNYYIKNNGYSNIYVISDIFICQMIINGTLPTPTTDNDLFRHYDINNDGVIDLKDMVLIQSMILGKR